MSDAIKLRVTGLVRDNGHASDWWRLLDPFDVARLNGHDCYCAVRGHPIVHPPDIVVMRGEFFRPGLFEHFIRQCEQDRVLVVQDYDDLYSEMDSSKGDRHLSNVGPVQIALQDEALKYSHLVTTTMEVLAQRIVDRVGRGVVVVPNALRLERWADLPHPKPERPLLVLSGSESHYHDYAVALPVIRTCLRAVPSLRVRIVGHDPGWVKRLQFQFGHDRVELREWVPFERYPTSFAGATIVWQPLKDTPINRCRTPIRHWEATAAGAAFIGAHLVYDQSVTNGCDGLLTDDPNVVAIEIQRMCVDEKIRAHLVSNARATIWDQHLLTAGVADARMNLYYEMWHEMYGGVVGDDLQYRPRLSRDEVLDDGTGTIRDLRPAGDGSGGRSDSERGHGAAAPGGGPARGGARLPRDASPDSRRLGAPLPLELWTPRGPHPVRAH